MSFKNVLVTGITGFIGSVLTRRLLQEGYSVFGFARKSSDFWRIRDIVDHCDIRYVDLCDEKKTEKQVSLIRPDIIYHLAANRASPLITSADSDIFTNIVGTRNLLKSLSKYDYELFVNAGSSSEYGNKDSPMHEENFLEPNSYHSFAKGAQTLLCQCCAVAENRPIITLRLFSVYGPYERTNRLIPSVVRGCLNGTNLNLSDPLVSRDFVYVDDVIDVCLKVDKLSKHTGKIFNIGTGHQTNIQKIVDTVFYLTGKNVSCNWNTDGRVWDTRKWVASIVNTKFELGWTYKYDILSGLRKTIEWTKKYEF